MARNWRISRIGWAFVLGALVSACPFADAGHFGQYDGADPASMPHAGYIGKFSGPYYSSHHCGPYFAGRPYGPGFCYYHSYKDPAYYGYYGKGYYPYINGWYYTYPAFCGPYKSVYGKEWVGGPVPTTTSLGYPTAPPPICPPPFHPQPPDDKTAKKDQAKDSKNDGPKNDTRDDKKPAKVSVLVPGNAELFVNGQPTTMTGGNRLFMSSSLTPGLEYTYVLRARWTSGGRAFDQEKRLTVQGGELRIVDFMNTGADSTTALKE